MTVVKKYLPLLLFPLIWAIYNAHYVAAWLGVAQNCNCPECPCESSLWMIYDSSTYSVLIIIASVASMQLRDRPYWSFGFLATGGYFLMTLILQWSGNNFRGDLLDEVLQVIAAIGVAGILTLMLRSKKADQ